MNEYFGGGEVLEGQFSGHFPCVEYHHYPGSPALPTRESMQGIPRRQEFNYSLVLIELKGNKAKATPHLLCSIHQELASPSVCILSVAISENVYVLSLQ